MLLKLDMSNVYDRMECDYLELSLVVMGFLTRFTRLVMQCVRIASFSILLNEIPKGPIVPSRGLRQGDPLSPYLFLICTKGLISLLKKLAFNGCLRGIRVCRGMPMINHLLFVNNNLIFCKTNKTESNMLLSILNSYIVALGQCVNIDKTKIFFSKNVKEEVRSEVMTMGH